MCRLWTRFPLFQTIAQISKISNNQMNLWKSLLLSLSYRKIRMKRWTTRQGMRRGTRTMILPSKTMKTKLLSKLTKIRFNTSKERKICKENIHLKKMMTKLSVKICLILTKLSQFKMFSNTRKFHLDQINQLVTRGRICHQRSAKTSSRS